MQGEIPLTGNMHCWLGAKAEVAGRVYVFFRGVNFDDEKSYDARHQGVEHLVPFFHTPSVKFAYGDPACPPSVEETTTRMLSLVEGEWPALAKVPIAYCDQDLSGQWGGFPETVLSDGSVQIKRDPVTRFVFDFGKMDALPFVIIKPHDNNLPWPRHPVIWVTQEEIEAMAPSYWLQQGNQKSHSFVEGEREIEMETKTGSRIVCAKNIVLQQTIADMYAKTGVQFSQRGRKAMPDNSLRVVKEYLGKRLYGKHADRGFQPLFQSDPNVDRSFHLTQWFKYSGTAAALQKISQP